MYNLFSNICVYRVTTVYKGLRVQLEPQVVQVLLVLWYDFT